MNNTEDNTKKDTKKDAKKDVELSVEKGSTILSNSINIVLQAAERLGAERDALVSRAGIDPVLLSSGDNRIEVARFFRLYQLADAATATPDIGLYAGRIAFVNGLNLQLYMSTLCETFREYLNLMPSVLKFVGDIGEVKIRRAGDFIRLEWTPLQPASARQRYLSDAFLVMAAAIVDSLCIRPVPVQRAHFSYAEPQDTSLLRTTFGDNLLFDQDVSCLYFHREALNYPIAHLNYELNAAVTRRLRRLFEEDETDPFLSSLRRSIVRLLPAGEMTIDTVAGELNVSRRTLQRRLADRDTQFMQVLQEVRVGLAERYLEDERLGITEIAFLLGYTDQGSFSSAFKSWHGVSPREFRQRE